MPSVDSRTVALARELIRRPSVTPRDEGCCALIAGHLDRLGFKTEVMPFGDVTNLWAVREGGRPGPTLVLAGHIDVVPPGPLEAWRSPPFAAAITTEGRLIGRGAADMKSSVAAFV
ncbi:MAG: M20/M25/M40 family metallo-hydrolase, partial [Burkholderiaceae bacterium]|nr:M20/M25/M40 family metallo-hydrolase [Burkholderiaceae bacterium]